MSTAPTARSDGGAAPRSRRRGVTATELRLFVRDPGTTFWILGFPTALLCILGAIPSFREPNADQGGQSVVDLYVPVVVLLTVIVASVQSMPATLSTYREQGILRRLRATPVSPAALLRAQVVLHLSAVAVGAATAVAVARLVLDVPLPQHLAGWLLALVLAAAAAFALGALVSAVAPTARVSQTIGTLVFFPLMFTAGVWLPVQTMPGLLQDVVLLTPLGAAARGLNDAATGSWPQLVDLAVTGGWAVVLTALAVRCFRWE
ncbi:ABC transporter permease [Nocardioides sp. CPCC 205120]|uniref:ABC transporter permease n=1 Tax=Nocardioides sp. CPCC 205120 TaxID=3406462 RepID=UPI003B50F540